jgi:hypothetical protein
MMRVQIVVIVIKEVMMSAIENAERNDERMMKANRNKKLLGPDRHPEAE